MMIGEYFLQVVRSARRKRIAFRIAPDGTVELLAPASLSDAVLQQIAADNIDLIEKLKQRHHCQIAPPAFVENSMFLLAGKEYPLHLSSRLTLFDGSRFIVPRGSEAEIKAAMIALYRSLALKYLTERTGLMAKQCGLCYQKVRISSASTRWGSCNSSKVITFSWKLIMCPEPLIDYVIIHELCHLVELNHSPEFWKIVHRFCPDFKARRAMLNRFGRKLIHW